MHRLLLTLAAGLLCALAWTAQSAEPAKDDLARWMSKEVQDRKPEERVKLLEQMVKARLDAQFLRDVFTKDPAAAVKLKALDAYAARFANDWKMIARLEEWFTPDVLADYELAAGALDTVLSHTEKNRALMRRTTSILMQVLTHLPYPEVPAANAKTKLTYVVGKDARKRDVNRTAEFDAAQAKRARELFGKALKDLNRMAKTDFQPSAKVLGEVEAWWQQTGGGRLFGAQDEWERIQKSGYSTIKSTAPAQVVTSTYLGTKGTEWLSGGGFQPDGTVVVAGTCLGPTFEFPGVAVKVLGPDGPAPGEPKAEPHPREEGVLFCWMHSQATPFVVRLSADLKNIVSAGRLPWCSGSVTGTAVDDAGNIYLAGPARKGLRQVCADAKDLAPAKALTPPKAATPAKTPPPPAATRPAPPPPPPDPHAWETAYVAKLTPSGDRVEWIRFVNNPHKCTNVPEVLWDKNGRVQFTSCDLRVLDARGNQLEQRDPTGLNTLPGRHTHFAPYGPWLVTAHEHNWPTGHEPWRCPYVAVRNPDGTRYVTLYDWPGPFVGGAGGWVADSFFYGFRFDRQGDLLLQGRCDGGNTILNNEPMDVLRGSPKMKGLGYSAAGQGATCLTFIIRVSTQTWKVTGGSIFQPGVVIDDVAEAPDGSVLAVTTGGGLRITDNHLCKGLPSAPMILVVNSDVSVHRFSSPMLGCGAARVGHTNWALASGTSGGRPKALFLTGALPEAKVYDWTFPVPSANALQKDFGGGALDGHVTVLDLGP